VVEPGDIVTFEQPIVGETLSDNTEYTHGIVVEVVRRSTDRATHGAPQTLGIAKYTPNDNTGLAGVSLISKPANTPSFLALPIASPTNSFSSTNQAAKPAIHHVTSLSRN
jgi:hypothetical protein